MTTTLSSIIEIIEAAEFDHYGLRAHRGLPAVVGAGLGKSHVWVNGECTDDVLDGISAIKITEETVATVLATVRSTYAWGGEQIVLVAGYYRTYGDDDGEIIIRDNICLAII